MLFGDTPKSYFRKTFQFILKELFMQLPLVDEDRQKALAPLLKAGWNVLKERDAIQKVFQFENFIQAFGFMSQVALYAEKSDHHPEWSNVYNRVTILWSTHECSAISQRDVDAALFCDMLYNK